MNDLKEYVANLIFNETDRIITVEEIFSKLEIPKDKENGDFAYPCFNLAKIMKKSPIMIASEIASKVVLNNKIEKVNAVNGYLNFYLSSDDLISSTLCEILEKKENYGLKNIGNEKNIVIDYSSPNIAKPFHLGHFRNTVLGSALYKLYSNLGYNVIGINHIGDWGRQFGLLIEGYKLFKNEYKIEEDSLKVLSDIYVRISKLAKENDEVMERARQNFKELEQGNEQYKKLWEYFREVSLKEYNRIYDILECKFDSYNGEAFYNDKMDEVVEILDAKGVLKESQGAKVVEMEENIPPCIILKSNGSTIYATRDLAAILYRVRNYDFYKAIYITGSEQILHFKQVFETAKYLVDEKYQSGLVHIPYGMIRLKTGKMSTREGNVIYVNDLINESIEKAKKIIEEKNPNIENKNEIAKIIGIGALTFNYLKTNKIKDMIFDLDEALRFDGETGPYVQYTYVRIKSIIEKSGIDISNYNFKLVDLSVLKEEEEIELVKSLNKFSEIIIKAADEYEPSIIARYLIDVSTLYSRFYNECSILSVEGELKIARLALCYCTMIVIKKGLEILGISCPDKM